MLVSNTHDAPNARNRKDAYSTNSSNPRNTQKLQVPGYQYVQHVRLPLHQSLGTPIQDRIHCSC